MWLKNHDHPAIGKGRPGGSQGRPHFGGMVSIIIHQQRTALGQWQFTHDAEAPTHPGKILKPGLNSLVRKAQFSSDGCCGRCVQGIVLTGHAQLHRQVRAFLRALQNESGRQSLYRHLTDPVIRIPVSAIGEGAARCLGQQALYTGIIQTEDGQAVERQVVHEIEECLLVVGGIPVVMIHVIGFDVGHDADCGQQMQK